MATRATSTSRGWTGPGVRNSSELLIQRMNRRQNQIDVLLANAQTGAVKTILVERDSAWVDVVNDVRWLDGTGGSHG